MNSRSQTFELRVEGRQVEEAVSTIFHTVLLYRTLGKFTVTPDGNYSVGTVGYQDVDCNFIDITYLCCSSQLLHEMLQKEISSFSHCLRKDRKGFGTITLEFFQRKKSHWPFTTDNIPWEVWNLRIDLLRQYTEELRETVGLSLSEKIIDITEIMNRNEYLPRIPVSSELATIFNTELQDVQPYLFNVSFMTADCSPSFGDAVRKVLKTTLFS